MISEEYKNLTYLEENNLKHEIKVFNVTKNIELTDYLEIDDLQINKFLNFSFVIKREFFGFFGAFDNL